MGATWSWEKVVEHPPLVFQEPAGLGTQNEGDDVMIDTVAITRFGGQQVLPELLGNPTQRVDRS